LTSRHINYSLLLIYRIVCRTGMSSMDLRGNVELVINNMTVSWPGQFQYKVSSCFTKFHVTFSVD
jgi:hypothetical protein